MLLHQDNEIWSWCLALSKKIVTVTKKAGGCSETPPQWGVHSSRAAIAVKGTSTYSNLHRADKPKKGQFTKLRAALPRCPPTSERAAWQMCTNSGEGASHERQEQRSPRGPVCQGSISTKWSRCKDVFNASCCKRWRGHFRSFITVAYEYLCLLREESIFRGHSCLPHPCGRTAMKCINDMQASDSESRVTLALNKLYLRFRCTGLGRVTTGTSWNLPDGDGFPFLLNGFVWNLL